MRDVAGRASDAGHLAELVELEQRFRKIEVDRSSANTFPSENERQLLHPLEPLDQTLVALQQFRIALEHAMDGGIRHPLDAADHATGEFLGDHITLRIDLQKRR